MKTIKFFTFFFLSFFLFQISSIAQNESLIVHDPQQWWGETQGNIDEALISLRPQGVYTEVGLYLTITDGSSNFSPGTQLEIEMNFDLPEGSIVHDSWLWVGDDIIRAKILDKWGANLIYEDIVDRRQDPSILFKLDPNSYNLRVYPLLAGESRKLKISYLVPGEWTNEKVLTTLPGNILNLSGQVISNVELIIWETDDFNTPTIEGIDLEPRQDAEFGNYFYGYVNISNHANLKTLKYDAPLKDGVYVNTFQDGDDQFYQLAVTPNFLFEKNLSKQVMIMFDHDAQNSTVNSETVLGNIKASLKEQLTGDDFFNLVKSGLFPQPVSSDWIPGDDASIDQAFEDLGELNNYSSLASVIAEGVEFVEEFGDEQASLFLISNTDEMNDLNIANEFLTDLQELMEDSEPRFHVFYYQNRNFNRFWANGQYFNSGEYLYSNVALLTAGEYIAFRNTVNIKAGMEQILSTLGEPIDFFDFYTTTQTGFCHSRFSNIDGQTKIFPNKSIVQVGKFEGAPPFQIRMNGSLNSEIKSKEISVEANEIWQADTLAREAWVGNFLQDLENRATTNEDVSEIIKVSLDERVLTEYTAFLCLEPSQGGEPCLDCLDEDEIVLGTNDPFGISDSLKIKITPNPFAEQVTITVDKPSEIGKDEVTCQVFNSLGRVVQTLEGSSIGESQVQFRWDGKSGGSNVGPGLYIGFIRIGEVQKSVKLIYQP